MSRARQTTLSLPQTTVRNPSRYGKNLHRLDSEADEIRPACSEGDYRDVDWNEVHTCAYYPNYDLCDNKECFPEAWR